jgi:predicted outer membrane repeat protein
MHTRTIAGLATILLLFSTASATTIYVDLNGGGDYETIDEGLLHATAGDTILIAPGVYTGPQNRDLSFYGRPLLVTGGPGAGTVTVDCEGLGRGFIFNSNEHHGSVLDGIEITRGWAIGGGGILCTSSSPTIRNCEITQCVADLGAGMSCTGGASPIIEHCVFKENVAETAGGGIRCDSGGDPVLTDVAFVDNEAHYGGGMMSRGGSSPTITGAIFDSNKAEFSGGLRCEGGSPVLDNLIFVRNEAFHSGGGMGSGNGSYLTLTNSVFIENSSGFRGGAFSFTTGTTISHCTFLGNSAERGAGFWCSPPIETEQLITNSIIALSGGAPVFCETGMGVPTITHSVIFANTAGDSLCGQYHDNLFVDPMFCDPGANDLTVHELSPCLGRNNPWGEDVGAFGAGCSWPTAVGETAVTWSMLKAMYR